MRQKHDMSGFYVRKAIDTKRPLDAIHAGCWLCRCGQNPSGCDLPECIYFPFRNGKNMYSGHNTAEFKEKAAERIANIKPWEKRKSYRATD